VDGILAKNCGVPVDQLRPWHYHDSFCQEEPGVFNTDENEATFVYRIVGQDEIEGSEGTISWKSPVGKALLGKAVGDMVVVRWHAGVRELTVTAITYL